MQISSCCRSSTNIWFYHYLPFTLPCMRQLPCHRILPSCQLFGQRITLKGHTFRLRAYRISETRSKLTQEGIPMSKCFLSILAGIGVSIFLPSLNAQTNLNAQKDASVRSVRLYVFDCGNLKSGNPQPLLDRGVTITDMSVAAYLIVHPRGTLLWDSGVIPDDLIKPGGTTEARATVFKTLKSQLAEIGYQPSDITYLALSHNHYDHSANANEFAGSTWLVQKAERDAMFPETPPK